MKRISENDLKIILNGTQDVMHNIFVSGSDIFISGATGFFGKWLMESFIYLNRELKLNSKMWALSRDPEKFLEQCPHFRNEECILWIKGDIRTFTFPEKEFDYIIHAATDADANLNAENPLLMIDTITGGTLRILEFANSQSHLKAFLLTSSGAVYGNQPEEVSHVKETDSFYIDINNPKSAYAEGKRLSELFCSVYKHQHNLPVKIARCFAFVGPYLPLNKHFAIGNFIRDGLQGENIVIQGNGSPLRSYMYAADLVTWLWTILLKGEIGDVYNVGSDESVSIKGLAHIISNFFPESSVLIRNQVRVTDRNNNYVPDVQKAKTQLGLRVGIQLKESIDKTIQFHKQND